MYASRTVVKFVASAGMLLPLAFWSSPVVSAQVSSDEIAPEALEYLDAALELMETRSINRASVDWEEMRKDAYANAAGATTTWDTYPAITAALVALGTDHSFLRPPLEYLVSRLGLPPEVADLEAPEPPEPEGQVIEGRIAHLRIPAFSGPDPDAFAAAILAHLQAMDEAGVCGWIVDLRGNGGGNMWPMLQGIAPVLGEGVPGYFRYPTGRRDPWPIESPEDGLYSLSRPNPPAAVLHDGRTASSGEAVVVAFRGRAGARSFGQGTAGLSTSNQTIELSDGAVMLLTTAVFEDRNGAVYGGVIEPDELVAEEATLAAALAWLGTTEECREPA